MYLECGSLWESRHLGELGGHGKPTTGGQILAK
jgi:hypothetical protein